MEKLLNLGNGAKTLIGVLLFMIMSLVCWVTGIHIPNFQEPASMADILKLLGTGASAFLTITGWADKIAKARTEALKKQLNQK